MNENNEIAGQLIPMGGQMILLPNGVVAEILRQAPLTAIQNAPQWLLGTFLWQGQEVSMISFPHLDSNYRVATHGDKCIIIKTLSPEASVACYAIHADAFPHFVDILRQGLLLDASKDEQPAGVLAAVLISGKTALIPDLDYIERCLEDWMGKQTANIASPATTIQGELPDVGADH